MRKRGQKGASGANLVPATPWDEPRTKGLRRDGYALRGERKRLLKEAYARGASIEELWEIAHCTVEHFPGWWWSDPEFRITSVGRRETPIPAHGFANLLYWLKHGRMFRPDGSTPYLEGDIEPFFWRRAPLKSQSVISNLRSQNATSRAMSRKEVRENLAWAERVLAAKETTLVHLLARALADTSRTLLAPVVTPRNNS